MTTAKPHYLKPEQLRVGLYVHLDLSWMDHPFTFNNFRIKDEAQIAEIRKLGLHRVHYDPLRSDCEPLPPAAAAHVQPSPAPQPERKTAAAEDNATIEKQAFQQRRLQALRQAIHECEKKFDQACTTVHMIEREIHRNPPKTMLEAQNMVDGMVDSLLSEGEVVLHAMQPRPGSAENYSHALNVTVLSLVLAKSLDMSADDARHLVVGALFHDLGKSQIPDRVSKKPEPPTRAELSLILQHPAMGAKFASELGMPAQVVRIILQHHECMDGTGYPGQLKQEQIDRLARIVAVANLYDNLCNPLNAAQAMTPYEALSHMFAHQRSKYDLSIMKLLIKSLGIYPPGSLVRLSSGEHGIVVSINPSKPLRPYILLHSPEVPRLTPLLINLGEEASRSITHCLRQNQLPKEVLDYLQPATRINYFFAKENPSARKECVEPDGQRHFSQPRIFSSIARFNGDL